MSQTAGNTVCSKRKLSTGPGPFVYSLTFKRLPSQNTNAITLSFYTTELGLLLFPLLLLRSDRLAPYCLSTFLAGTHNYLARIHKYFFSIQTMTTLHRGLPLGGCYCTISFFFSCALPTLWARSASPGLRSCSAWPPGAVCAGSFQVVAPLFAFCFSFVLMIVHWVFLILPACCLT